MLPADAVQPVGDRFVVYVPGGQPDAFVEREVQVGARIGDLVQIESGVAPGERVVTRGAFFLRAEQERVSPSAHQH